MPRQKGFDKQAMERRNALELVQFNTRLMVDDFELLSRLLEQEMKWRSQPSERLVNAAEIAERLKRYTNELMEGDLYVEA
jgi:hypothetical protein